MIALYRTYPLRAIKDKVLLSRLAKNHYLIPIIDADYHREDAGHWGEAALDYYLTFLPEEKYYIFQHIRLKIEQWTFQIDFLLLTTHFGIIIEAKNLKGTIYFDSKFGQVIQTHNDTEKGYDDPVAQADRQHRLLKKWLKKNFGQILPIDYIVVMSNTNAILKTDSDEIPKKVCKPYKVIQKIEIIEQKYQTEQMEMDTLEKLKNLLIQSHTPEQCDILNEYKLKIEDIPTGVLCPKCESHPMVYQNGKWYCSICNTVSKDAHIASLYDYFLLIKPSITNKEFREFLHLPNGNVAQKLLASLNLPSTGSKRNRIYYPKESDLNALYGQTRQATRHKIQR